MQRKLIKVGTSAAVLIPKTLLDEQDLKVGDTIYVEFSRHETKNQDLEVNPAVLEWTEKLRKRYKPLLKKLVSS